MDKTVKNVLAAVGAVAVVKAAPVLALGAAIGAVASNPEKVKKAAEDLVFRVEDQLAKYGVEVWPEDECECCEGGHCTCDGECQCDSDEEPELHFDCASAPMEAVEPESWEEVLPDEEEEAPVADEPAPEPTATEADKLENLRALGMEFIAALKDVAADALK